MAMGLLIGGLFLTPAHSGTDSPSTLIQIVGVPAAVITPIGAHSYSSTERNAGYLLQDAAGVGTNPAGVTAQNAPNAIAQPLSANTTGSGNRRQAQETERLSAKRVF